MRDAIAGFGVGIRKMPTFPLFCALVHNFILLDVSIVPYFEDTPARLFKVFDFPLDDEMPLILFNGVASFLRHDRNLFNQLHEQQIFRFETKEVFPKK